MLPNLSDRASCFVEHDGMFFEEKKVFTGLFSLGDLFIDDIAVDDLVDILTLRVHAVDGSDRRALNGRLFGLLIRCLLQDIISDKIQ